MTPVLREASFDDYHRIAALECSVGLKPRPPERWMRLWCENPAYHAIPGWPIGWVLEDHGEIVGSIGNVPSIYHWRGRNYFAATLIGWAVDPRYRAFSLMLVAHHRRHPQTALHLVTTAGPMPQAVLTRLGWSKVPVGAWDHAAFWVTSYADALGAFFQHKLPRAAAAARLLGAPLAIADRIARQRRFEIDCDLAWEPGFDPAFDAFWTELLKTRRATLLADRSARALKWHFGHALETGDAWVLTARRASRLAAYAIFERRDASSAGLRRMMLADFQTLAPDCPLASAMISRALERSRREGIHVLENLGCWMDAVQPLDLRTPNRRALPSWCYLYKAGDPELAAALEDSAAWYPTQYDGDATL